MTGSAELAATQTGQWNLSRVMATELQGSLQSMREGEIVSVLVALASVQDQLVSESNQAHDCIATDTMQQRSNELVTFIYLRQNELYKVYALH